MLVAMAIDPTALEDAGRAGRDTILKAFQRHGLPAFGPGEAKVLKEQFTSNHPEEWPRWREMLLTAKTIKCAKPVAEHAPDDLTSLSSFPTVYSSSHKVVKTWIDGLGETDTTIAHVIAQDGPVEVVATDCVGRSTLLSDREQWSTATLPPLTHRSELSDRITSLVTISKGITIVDRYAFTCLRRELSDGGSSGTLWLLRELAKTTSLCPLSIRIFGCETESVFDTKDDFDSLADAIWADLSGTVASLEMHPGPAGKFRQLSHQRVIRFHSDRQSRVVILDNSLDSFCSERLGSAVALNYRPLTSAQAAQHQELESRLEVLAQQGLGSFVRS